MADIIKVEHLSYVYNPGMPKFQEFQPIGGNCASGINFLRFCPAKQEIWFLHKHFAISPEIPA